MPTLLYLIFALISPVYAFILYMMNIKGKMPNIKDVIISTIIISLVGIYWFPWGDNQTHFAIYHAEHVKYYHTFLTNPYDYILKIISDFTGQYSWGYFVWIFIPLCLYFTLLWKRINTQNISRNDYILVFITMLTFIGIREVLDLNRNTAAFLFYTSSLLLYDRKKIFSIITLLFSILLHSSIIYLLLVSLIIYVALRKLTPKRLLIYMTLCLLMSLLGTEIITAFGSETIVERYVTGQWGKGGSGVQSGFMRLLHYTSCLIFISTFVVIFKNLSIFKNKHILSSYLASVFLVVIYIMFYTIRERFIVAGCILGMTLILTSWKHLKRKSNPKLYLKLILSFSIAKIALILCVTYSSYFIHRTDANDPVAVTKIVSHVLYYPTPMLLDIESNGFSNYEYLKNFNRSTLIE